MTLCKTTILELQPCFFIFHLPSYKLMLLLLAVSQSVTDLEK